jgi:tetratricopeptide (TPR) repeat protein
MKNLLLLFGCFVLFLAKGYGQPSAVTDSSGSFKNAKAVNSSSEQLLKSIRENKSPETIAQNYYHLAEELVKAGDLPRAELYMSKAIQLEPAGKTKAPLAAYYRELARIQELQHKNSNAAESYKKAADLSTDSLQKQLNRNDALRLQDPSPQTQLQYLNQNNTILSNSSDQNEKFQNYTQLANTNIALNQNEAALGNYKDALNTVNGNSANSIAVKSGMVDILTATNNFPDAIALQKSVVDEAKINSSVEVQAAQLRNLSALYLKLDSTDAALKMLKDAYHLSIANGNLKEAKESLAALASFYEKHKQNQEAADLYRSFLGQLDNLIAKDSNLIDKNLFLVNEGKIAELEKQQTLKDELIAGKNTSNFILIGSVVLLLTLLLLIVKALLSIRKRNKQIALQSLRREMNPHFIFNSLNSVNQFIASNNEREANKYLSSYSNLMRNMLENSNKDYVPLSTEIDQLKKYLELEKLRFPDKFEYKLEIDPALDTETVMVPNMIIQPNIENAIWHGLRYKNQGGLLQLKFSKKGNKTMVTIEDDGIGLTESKKLKTKNQKMHESLGLKNVEERIRLLNDIYRSGIRFEIKEKTGKETGVLVQIEW